MKIPRSDEASNSFLKSVLPKDDPQIKIRPMFGNLAAFSHGKMFAGLYGNQLFVRLPEESQIDLLQNNGATVFEPMKGRPMTGFIVIPKEWWQEPAKIKDLVSLSLRHVSELRTKKSNAKKRKRR